jgi:hypothetical protein
MTATTTRSARWLDSSTLPDISLRRALVERAMADILIEETAGPNRSPYIDEILRDADAKPGDPWCAAALNRWCRDAGVARPPRYQASCDVWMAWAKKNGSWNDKKGYNPMPGDIVVYGKPADAQHIGVVGRITSRGPRAIEGNTSYGGDGEREGIACDAKPVKLSWVLGYITPKPAISNAANVLASSSSTASSAASR